MKHRSRQRTSSPKNRNAAPQRVQRSSPSKGRRPGPSRGGRPGPPRGQRPGAPTRGHRPSTTGLRRPIAPKAKEHDDIPLKDRRLSPTIESLLLLLKKAEIKLNREQITQLWRYHNLIRSRNLDRDLTRITGFEPMIVKHYIDSMIVGKYFSFPSPIVDIGTGAGFPGIPLKIRYPHLKIILAEHRPKRIAFLKEVISELKLRNIEVFEHKVVSQSFKTPVKGVVTRALEEIEKTILRTSAALETGGYLIFLKGPAVDPEIEQAKRRFGDSIKLIMHQKFYLPHAGHERRLVIFQKTGDLLANEKKGSAIETEVESDNQHDYEIE